MSQLCWAQTVNHAFIPREGRLLVIGQQKDAINGYIKDIGMIPGGFMVYTSIQNMEGLEKPADQGAGINDAQYYVDHYPNAVIQLALYMVGAEDGVLKRQYDQNILKLARWIKSAKRPVYFRIGYEFDLPANRYDPVTYQHVYRYIVDKLRAEGVDNVAYVWHSATMIDRTDHVMDWYPGDDYVDWFAISFFDSLQMAMAKKFSVLSREHHKPLMIAESTPAGLVSVRGKKDWFKHYFDFIHEQDVKVVCYINSEWDTYPLFQSMKWGDARIQKDLEIKALWLKETENYLQSSPELFHKLAG